jgi:hypothetical protein
VKIGGNVNEQEGREKIGWIRKKVVPKPNWRRMKEEDRIEKTEENKPKQKETGQK